MFSLDKLIDGLEVEIDAFALCEVRGQGRLDLGCHDQATLHYTLAGSGRIRLSGGAAIPVVPHTVLIVPAGLSHRLEAAADTARCEAGMPHCGPLEPGWQRLASGVGPTGVLLACGALRATYHRMYGLFDYLPGPIVEHLDDADSLRSGLANLLAELANPQPGGRVLTRLLMLECLVLLLRRLCRRGQCGQPWLLALEEPRLGRAVAAILEHPDQPHSVEALARTVGMSRSAFARHFAEAFGRGPMDLVREVRLRRAARLLHGTDRPIKALAADVGYVSRSHFSRAFRALFGVSPSEFRTEAETVLPGHESKPPARR